MTNYPTVPPEKESTDASRLAALYPEPKTEAQKEQDDAQRQLSYRQRWPRYPYLNIAAHGSILAGIVLWFSQNVGYWWFSGDNTASVMGIVFFSFALGLGIMGLLFAWVNYANKLFSYFGRNSGAFWFAYLALTGLVVTISIGGWILAFTNILWLPIFVILNFLIIFVSAKIVFGNNIRNLIN